MQTFDFLIVGAGIIGLAMARELRARHPKASIAVLEKEDSIGQHASGRNSGVLHSGIYYKEGSLKAQVCAEGAREMAAYCKERDLPLSQTGKVILPVSMDDGPQLDLLYKRAKANGARVEIIDKDQLKEIEPAARSVLGKALYAPETSVIDPKRILASLSKELEKDRIQIIYNSPVHTISKHRKTVLSDSSVYSYGHLINAAGIFADKIAKAFDIGQKYVMAPFKGLYYDLSPKSALQINHLIYPVPDLNVPFLGVHFTKSVSGNVYVGPTAIPALGRENYTGLDGMNLSEAAINLMRMGRLYLCNQQGFRRYAHEEASRFIKKYFIQAARNLVPDLVPSDLVPSKKVGIRAQLLDTKQNKLVSDFLVERAENSTHILNAVSPAFTSAFSFSRLVVENYI